MPKVTITNAKGVKPEAGSGGIKIAHGSVSGSAGVEGLRVAAGGASGFLHMIQGSTTLSSSATHHTITSLLPRGSRVLAGKVEVTTAAHRPYAITSIGTNQDYDAFSGTVSVSSSLGNGQVLSPIALVSLSTGSSDVTITSADTGTSWPGGGTAAGTTVTEGVARVTLFVATAATTEG